MRPLLLLTAAVYHLHRECDNIMENTAKKFGTTLKGPEHIGVDITNMCNMQCLHCYNRSNVGSKVRRKELSDEDLLDLAKEVREIEPPSFCFCGGEPLMRYDVLRKMLERLRNDITKAGLVTNGYLMTASIAKELAGLGLYTLQVSVDGADAKTHERMRGVFGGYKMALEALKMGWNEGIPLRAVAFSPTKFNVNQFGLFAEQMHSLHVNTIRVQPLMNIGAAIEHPDIFPSNEQYDELVECIAEKKVRFPDIRFEWGDPLDHLFRCSDLVSEFVPFVTIQVDGSIVVSPYVPITIGNIRRHSLQEYWDAGLWRIWENKFIRQVAGFYDSMSALSRCDVPVPVVYHEGNVHFDLIDDKVLEITDNQMQSLYWERASALLGDAPLSCVNQISDVEFDMLVEKDLRNGVSPNKVAIAIGNRNRNLDVVQAKRKLDDIVLRHDPQAWRVGKPLEEGCSRVEEQELAHVICFLENCNVGDIQDFGCFRLGVNMSSYDRLHVRTKMFQRTHRFYAYRKDEEFTALMCVGERLQDGCAFQGIAEVEMMLAKGNGNTVVPELVALVRFAEEDLMRRPRHAISVLRFVTGDDVLVSDSALKSALEGCGYVEEGRFMGVKKQSAVVVVSKRLKKSEE